MGRFKILAVLFLLLLFARPVSGLHMIVAGFDFAPSEAPDGGRV